MFVHSRGRTVCLMAAMLVAFLTAAWGKEATAPGDLRQPKATLTISGLLRADVRAQVDASVRLLDDRGQARLAGQVRTMLAEGRLVEGIASEGPLRGRIERGTTGQKTEGDRSPGSGDMNPSSGAPLPGSGPGAGGPVAP